MKSKWLAILVAMMMVIGLMGGVAAGNNNEVKPYDPEGMTLYAGQDTEVGTVYVDDDEGNLFVKYEITEEGWCITETHVNVGESLDDFPLRGRWGNPAPGQFDYTETHAYVTEYEYEIPLDDWETGDTLLIAAHADVVKSEELTVDSGDMDGTDSTIVLKEGESYTIEASGTWTNMYDTEDAHEVDAAGYNTYYDEDEWEAFESGNLQLQVNKDFVDWGEFDEVHIYELDVEGEDETVNFRVFDGDAEENEPIEGWYDDNEGELTVNIERDESAWADGTRFTEQGNWATYFQYTGAYALDFDGEDGHVEMPHDESLAVTDEFAISAWFWHREGLDDEDAGWYGQIGQGEGDYRLGWTGWAEGWGLDFWDDDGNRHNIGATERAVPEKEWFHVVGLYDPPYLKIYINGVLENEADVGTHELRGREKPFKIEADHWEGWDGQIDDVRLYNEALSEDEVQDLHDKRYKDDVAPESLVGWWPLNEGEGETAYDESGNENDGTIHNATWKMIIQ